MAGRHCGQTIADEVGLRVVVGVTKDVRNGYRVGCHETATADEALVDEGGTVRGLPVRDEVCVLLVVHLREVPKQERR